MTGSKAKDLSAITTDNIIKPALKDLSEAQRQGLDEWKKRNEEFEALRLKREQEDEELYLASFKLDRQVVTAPIKEP